MTDTKKRILEAAIHEFSQHGFDRGIVHIARRANVSDATVYRAFAGGSRLRTKQRLQDEALLYASANNPAITYIDSLLTVEPPPSPAEVIAELSRIACGEGSDNLRMIYIAALCYPEVLARWEANAERPRTLAHVIKYVERIQRNGVMTDLETTAAARLIVGMMFARFTRNHLLHDTDMADQQPESTHALVSFLHILTQ